MIPESMPSPALSIGMISGVGLANLTPVVVVRGVVTFTFSTARDLVASKVSSVTSSSTSCLNWLLDVFTSLRSVTLWAISGWSAIVISMPQL